LIEYYKISIKDQADELNEKENFDDMFSCESSRQSMVPVLKSTITGPKKQNLEVPEFELDLELS
jgi:hypothetical protein